MKAFKPLFNPTQTKMMDEDEAFQGKVLVVSKTIETQTDIEIASTLGSFCQEELIITPVMAVLENMDIDPNDFLGSASPASDSVLDSV